jgi:hypothetical protein
VRTKPSGVERIRSSTRSKVSAGTLVLSSLAEFPA